MEGSLYYREDRFDPFTVVLFKALQVLAFLFFIALLAMKPASDPGKVVKRAEFIITMTWPDQHPDDVELAGRILHVEVDVVGMLVGPCHGDDELGPLDDLAGVGRRLHRQEGNKEQEGKHLQRLEQNNREGVETVLPVVERAFHADFPNEPTASAKRAAHLNHSAHGPETPGGRVFCT